MVRTAALIAILAASTVVVAGTQSSQGPSCHTKGRGLQVVPDRSCTPGEWIPDQDLSRAHVCSKGYNPRPGTDVTGPLKARALKLYGLPAPEGKRRELDHLFPRWLGGATTLANLWPEPNYARPRPFEANPKDRLEFAVYRATCQRGALTVAQARAVFEGDWRRALVP